MIKLNNKNITYVALADTNNSLKAPKEIWYADTNNSVKLVYRRKDALIEGEDYEKYHWLNGRNGAYINTLHKLIPCEDVFDCHFKWDGETTNPNGKTQCVFGCYFYQGTNSWMRAAIAYNLFYINYFKLVNWNTIPTNEVYDVEIKSLMSSSVSGNYSFTLNGVTHEYSNNGLANTETNADVLLFENIANNGTYFHGDIASFKITDTLSNTKMNITPCKLLKPIPKWLDANGIRRQVGECGMIDLVSGKFYGNVNSVGTFTVENYYERKEWLRGDGSAYIDTLHLANDGLEWETHVSNLSFKKCFIWNRVTNQECPSITLYHSALSNGTIRVQNNYTNTIELQNQTSYDYIVATNSNGAVINGVQYIGQSASENISNKSIKLFYCDIDEWNKEKIIQNGENSQDVKCAYFRFLDANRNYIQNLIPCTLTMDLPASMDANNIARAKGTSGMWDLVSDKFYGNVASSGTFKAVNLAEGVDYEVHKWLRAEVDVAATMCLLPTDSNIIEFKSKRIRGRNFHYFRTDGGYAYFCASGLQKAIYNYNTSSTIYYSSIVALGEEVIISCNDSKILMGSDELPIYGYPINDVRISVADSEGMKTLTSSITVDGIECYIPVKLLKSIPSKYDANGIARNAGECGMYDTVNDVFYGNVASSGTFSVSDDS